MDIDNQIRRSETYRNPVRILVRVPDFWSELEPGPVRGTDLGSKLLVWSGFRSGQLFVPDLKHC